MPIKGATEKRKIYHEYSFGRKYFKIYLINTFIYHVSCTDGKISVRIIYFHYLMSTAQAKRQETEETTRPVENFTLATKGLQERKQLVIGTTVEK